MRARSALKESTHTRATFSNALKISARKMVIRSSLVGMKKSVLPFFNFEWCVKFITDIGDITWLCLEVFDVSSVL